MGKNIKSNTQKPPGNISPLGDQTLNQSPPGFLSPGHHQNNQLQINPLEQNLQQQQQQSCFPTQYNTFFSTQETQQQYQASVNELQHSYQFNGTHQVGYTNILSYI